MCRLAPVWALGGRVAAVRLHGGQKKKFTDPYTWSSQLFAQPVVVSLIRGTEIGFVTTDEYAKVFMLTIKGDVVGKWNLPAALLSHVAAG